MSRNREPRLPKLVHEGPYVRGGMLENNRLFRHQKDALEALAKWFKKDSLKCNKTAVVVMPTGTGKTGVICCLPYYFGAAVNDGDMDLDLSKPVLIIAPNVVILDQLERQYFDPDNDFLLKRGIITASDCAGNRYESLQYTTNRVKNSSELTKRQLCAEIVLSNAQQWHERNEEPVWKTLPNDHFSIVIVDEAHHLPAKQWQGIVDRFHGHAKVCFFTATPTRYDGKPITSDGSIQTHGFAYELSRDDAVKYRIIRNITPTYIRYSDSQHTTDPVDNVRLKCAYQVIDRVIDMLMAKNEKSPLPGSLKHQAMIIASSIDEAKRIATYGSSRARTSVIHSKLPKSEIAKVKEQLKSGDTETIVTVEMLLEGFDHPPISIVGIATRIRSCVKFQQFIGRAQRVVRSNGEPEDEAIKADIVTHEYFKQKELYDHFIRPTIPEYFEEVDDS